MKNLLHRLFVCCCLNLSLHCSEPKKAIVIGASSGMGRQVAKLLAQEGYLVGIIGRRLPLLESLQKEIPSKTYIKQIDVTHYDAAVKKLDELIIEMGGMDLILISISAANNLKTGADCENNKKTLAVDLLGFWYMANAAVTYFEKQGHGHLVGISSTSGLIGEAQHPVYSGAKAFISRYLEATRNKMIQHHIPISVTDIIPGWVEIEAEDVYKIPEAYWIATTQEAAAQIVQAIKDKKKKAYITRRWKIIAFLYQICPDWLYNAVGGF